MQKYQKMTAYQGRKCRLKARHRGRDPDTEARREFRRQQRKASSQKNQKNSNRENLPETQNPPLTK